MIYVIGLLYASATIRGTLFLPRMRYNHGMPKRSRLMTSRKRQILRRMLTSEKKRYNNLKRAIDKQYFIQASLMGRPLKKGYKMTVLASSGDVIITKDGKDIYQSEDIPESKVFSIIEDALDISKAKVVSYA